MTGGTVGGTYTLVVELLSGATVEVGALGELSFEPGWYAYTGSALGSGGFARVDRHRELAADERDTRHWHVDYLLGLPNAAVDGVTRSPGVDAECTIAAALDGKRVPDFGCSDCGCRSHLVYSPQRAPLFGTVERAHRTVRADRRQPAEE